MSRMPSEAQLLRRIEALERAKKAASNSHIENAGARIRSTLFDRQLRLEDDRSRRKAALCTRRAGKTDWVPKHFYTRALAQPESIRVYLAITRLRAKELIWRPLQLLDAAYNLGAKFNETLATITLPNHAVIRLRGADDKREADKGRGDKLHEVVIDEAQIFPSEVLSSMADDVYGPTLEDVGGDLTVLGTPGVVCAGKWYEMTQPDASKRERGWSAHFWSVLDNPFMAHMKKRLPEMKLERGWADDNPTYLREWCGQWVDDPSALFYAFDSTRNLHDRRESEMLGGNWAHTLGWDIGKRDAMALVAWAFHPGSPDLYEAFSWSMSGATTDKVMEKVRMLEKRGYNFLGKVADTGGLGALVVDETGARYSDADFGAHFEAAKKTEKGAHVELFNDELRCGRVKLMRGSPLAREMAILPKDPEAPAGKWPIEDARFANHCCDAGLYSWRRATNWLYEAPPPDEPKIGTQEWFEQEQARQQQELEAQMEREFEANRRAKQEQAEIEGWL